MVLLCLQIHEKIFDSHVEIDSPIEIARAYLRSKAQKSPGTLGLRHKVCHKNKAFSGKNLLESLIVSKSTLSSSATHRFYQNMFIDRMAYRKSLYKLAHPELFGSSRKTNPKVCAH